MTTQDVRCSRLITSKYCTNYMEQFSTVVKAQQITNHVITNFNTSHVQQNTAGKPCLTEQNLTAFWICNFYLLHSNVSVSMNNSTKVIYLTSLPLQLHSIEGYLCVHSLSILNRFFNSFHQHIHTTSAVHQLSAVLAIKHLLNKWQMKTYDYC